ncbi:hypothetical protein MPSEU_000338400 [Mayamaea pseudoterrestris]|nr:hypothetical protein MPSEU_000338400 [Mayamaea pseudoterrestris]
MAESINVDQNKLTYENVLHKKQQGALTLTSEQLTFQTRASSSSLAVIPWSTVSKHQVSPATYPKPLLKIILQNSTNLTFQLANRNDLEGVRNEITDRLLRSRSSDNINGSATKKRTLTDVYRNDKISNATAFDDLDPTVLAVTRSALLAANPALRKQHSHLVCETQTLAENDFWETHQSLLEEEYAKISGVRKSGTSSFFASHLPSSGRIVLGVEEMRQIFILYPAVHKAYEEKVPLELSDEQFWRKYLESEYFHRDRGRMGEAARNHADPASNQSKRPKKTAGPSVEEQEARAAAVGTDDLFSRYDQKIKKQQAADANAAGDTNRRAWGRRLACGQFDLASTFETERGHLLEPKDNFPPNQADDGKGARVIQKYNRHWAMVLHPDDAVAGSDLQQVARKSVNEVLHGDQDANAGGGLDKEMRNLVAFASASEGDADHAAGLGVHQEYEQLTLSNVEAYYSGLRGKETADQSPEAEQEAVRLHIAFANSVAAQIGTVAKSTDLEDVLPASCFPPASLGRGLLAALTKKMVNDSKTEEASLEAVKKLPEEFRNNLQLYFGRSSELLRHFYGLRKISDQHITTTEKIGRIVRGMESFYREMEQMRNQLPQTDTGETMRKMLLPIMRQLDWAFQLHREGSGGGSSGGGGFVTVES